MKLEVIWKEYRSNIKAFLHSKVSNHDDVDDLLQEILIKTYKNIDKLTSKTSVKPWLFQIANNTIIDFYRKKSRLNENIKDEFYLDEAAPDTQGELAQCIEPFIKNLPSDNAALLEAIDIKGVSQKEYAADNDISYSTLKSRVQKSRDLLRKLFDDCCHLSFDESGRVIEYTPKSNTCYKNC